MWEFLKETEEEQYGESREYVIRREGSTNGINHELFFYLWMN